uniref:Uncharacterized protein n=1 Tax=Lepeophtheirus salmonis TaxID=72036 RepID=A0A0K2U1P1_LEPSM
MDKTSSDSIFLDLRPFIRQPSFLTSWRLYFVDTCIC